MAGSWLKLSGETVQERHVLYAVNMDYVTIVEVGESDGKLHISIRGESDTAVAEKDADIIKRWIDHNSDKTPSRSGSPIAGGTRET